MTQHGAFERYDTHIRSRIGQHQRFWRGSGPSLLFVPVESRDLYDLDDYERRFAHPRLMYEAERARAGLIRDWPTDGIPTVRPNLGTIFIPSCMGQPYQVGPNAMPWPGQTLSREELRARHGCTAFTAELMEPALEFYRHAARDGRVYPYHPDTQGVFDVAHLVYGDEIFLDLATEDERKWITDLMDMTLEWFVSLTRAVKAATNEPDGQMVHGHGTAQGLYFPTAGTRISEDTATLLSPVMIEERILPFMERSAQAFGGAFVHYCGRHDALFSILCEAPWCRAIDLGNPESYDTGELLRRCAVTETVLYSRLPAEAEEAPLDYVRRIGRLVAESGARVVLRATVVPQSRLQAQEMTGLFHELTERHDG